MMDPLPVDTGTVDELVDICIQSFGESIKKVLYINEFHTKVWVENLD